MQLLKVRLPVAVLMIAPGFSVWAKRILRLGGLAFADQDNVPVSELKLDGTVQVRSFRIPQGLEGFIHS